MPPEPKIGLFRRSIASSWGSYDQVPDAASAKLERREEDSSESSSTDGDAKKKTEKPKSGTHESDDATGSHAATTSSNSKSASSKASASASATASGEPDKGGKGKKKPKPSDTSPPAGILPACYSSASACESTTHFCSGRGKCQKKYGGGSSKEARAEGGGGGDVCFSCVCEPQKEKSEDGESTTYWGGPACQKKDVSVEFWLLAGFTVVLVGAVGWGIGLLYEMGSQELPSVLGAGVAGPRPK